MKYTSSQYAEALFLSIQDVSKAEVKSRIAAFVALVYRNRATSLFPRIASIFAERWDSARGTERISITSARPLSASGRTTIVRALGLGTHAEVEETNDPSLIGGVRIAHRDTIIDGSVRAALDSLREVISIS